MVATYLDSSAIVKLAVREPESLALRRYLRRRQPLVSSALARTEVLRALLPAGDEAVARGRSVLQRFDLVRVNDQILNAAGGLRPPELRSLDAIHLATAEQLGDELSALVTYDDRMITAAKRLGYKVVQPR
jgi:predicted nucleic acid-binding protein